MCERPPTPDNIRQLANAALNETLPDSQDAYNVIYTKFMSWRTENKLQSFSENVILSYMYYLSSDKQLAPTTMWSYFSMLKCLIQFHHKIDIGKYNSVISYLKKKSEGYEPTQAEAFTGEEIMKFLVTAPDYVYLAHKVSEK